MELKGRMIIWNRGWPNVVGYTLNVEVEADRVTSLSIRKGVLSQESLEMFGAESPRITKDTIRPDDLMVKSLYALYAQHTEYAASLLKYYHVLSRRYV